MDLCGRRRADGEDGADGDEADAVLLREPARLLLREHLGDWVPLRCMQCKHGAIAMLVIIQDWNEHYLCVLGKMAICWT